MDKDLSIPSLDESFCQRPVLTSKDARRKSQALPLSELQELGFDIAIFENNNQKNSSGSSSSSSSDSSSNSVSNSQELKVPKGIKILIIY